VQLLTDVFSEVRANVDMTDLARKYGYIPSRSGFICCPFHREKTASLKLYRDHFKCFGCGAGGSVIDFTARLFNLDALDAVRRINDDFHLSLPLDRRPTPEQQQAARRRIEIARAHRAFEQWRNSFILRLNNAFRTAQLLDIKDIGSMTENEALALKQQATAEYLANTLEHGTPEQQAQIYRERRDIDKWLEKILKK
jgi:DNA primase